MHPNDRAWRERGLHDAVLAGDEQAWRTWYDESFAGLYGYVLWRCGGLRDRADEVVQETWLTAVRRLRAFDPGAGSFAGWLRGIAANLLRNHCRREDRRRRHTRPLGGGEAACGPPDGGLEERDRAERVARTLSALPGHYEAVLRAKYLDGQSVAEIAARTGASPKAVESLLTRARQAFRAAYVAPESPHHARRL
jgi:RNA polymerase sigma-70 factor (ECF subfamily)